MPLLPKRKFKGIQFHQIPYITQSSIIDPSILFYAINQVVNQVSNSKQSTDTPLQLQVKVLNEAIKKKKTLQMCSD